MTIWLTALASFVLVVLSFGAVAVGAADAFAVDAAIDRIRLLVTYAQLVPLPALAARRLHDTGLSGWFALPVVPLCLIGAFSETMDVLNGYQVYRLRDQWSYFPFVTTPLFVLYLIVLLQPARPSADRFGPDPRF